MFIKKGVFSIFISILLTVVCLSGCVQNSNQFSDLVTENSDKISPSEKYSLELIMLTEKNVSGYRFIVKSCFDKNEIFQSDIFFRNRDTNYILWGEDDVIWAYSGDIGTHYWKRVNNIWVKNTYADNKNDITVPDTLKKLKPSIFK